MKGLNFILAISLALPASSSFAQSETGTRLGGRPAQVPETGSNTDRARIWLERYAACVVKRDPKRVAEALDAEITRDVAIGKFVQGNFDACLSSGGGADQLAMSPGVMRGALYADRVTSMVRNLTPEMLPPEPLSLPLPATVDAATQARIATVRFGECVMRRNPQGALAFVAAAAAKAGETNALKTLTPFLGECVDAGVKVELSRSGLEAALAEAIYRTVRAKEAAPGKREAAE